MNCYEPSESCDHPSWWRTIEIIWWTLQIMWNTIQTDEENPQHPCCQLQWILKQGEKLIQIIEVISKICFLLNIGLSNSKNNAKPAIQTDQDKKMSQLRYEIMQLWTWWMRDFSQWMIFFMKRDYFKPVAALWLGKSVWTCPYMLDRSFSSKMRTWYLIVKRCIKLDLCTMKSTYLQ